MILEAVVLCSHFRLVLSIAAKPPRVDLWVEVVPEEAEVLTLRTRMSYPITPILHLALIHCQQDDDVDSVLSLINSVKTL